MHKQIANADLTYLNPLRFLLQKGEINPSSHKKKVVNQSKEGSREITAFSTKRNIRSFSRELNRYPWIFNSKSRIRSPHIVKTMTPQKNEQKYSAFIKSKILLTPSIIKGLDINNYRNRKINEYQTSSRIYSISTLKSIKDKSMNFKINKYYETGKYQRISYPFKRLKNTMDNKYLYPTLNKPIEFLSHRSSYQIDLGNIKIIGKKLSNN